MLKPKLQALFESYQDSHQHPVNRLTHKLAIPVIVFQIVAMLDWVKLLSLPGTGASLSLGHLAFLGALGWYLSMNVRLALLMGAAMAICFPLGWWTPRPLVVALALLGWLIQLAGHVVWERKSPAFLTNLLQALVGPMFFVALLTGDWKLPSAPQKAPQPV